MKKTPLFEIHRELGAKMVEFAGFVMPIQYTSIIDEHLAVRNNVGIFDVSHMGDITVHGDGAAELLSYLFTNDVKRAEHMELKYTHMLNDDGKIIDDMIATRISDDEFFIVPNAATTEKVYRWFNEHNEHNVKIEIVSDAYVCYAVQGPKSEKVLQRITGYDLKELKFFYACWTDVGPVKNVLVSRSGYTGEDGFELIAPSRLAAPLWKAIMRSGEDYNIKPVGLGARDTLRLEKGFLLSGQDFNEDRTPLEANHEWVIKWDHEFIGKEALLKQKDEGIKELLVGISMDDKGIPRHGYKIKKNGEVVGEVTSGTMSPILKKGIALGYVKKEYSSPDTEMTVEIHGKDRKCHVVKLPFV